MKKEKREFFQRLQNNSGRNKKVELPSTVYCFDCDSEFNSFDAEQHFIAMKHRMKMLRDVG